MGELVALRDYRVARKKAWLKENQGRLQAYLYDFLRQHVGLTYAQAADSYQSMRSANYEEAWDFVDLRDLLHQAMQEEPFSDELYEGLRVQRWFDARLLSKDEAIERCLSLYIMDAYL